ncbi:MAG: glycosyltransferase [Candidatus Bathyarchaeota archaeon]|nr:MAG: glycosyltransferase [Candidatus Bathyarchaeota archaeon]
MPTPKDAVTIVLPTLNEELAIGQVIKELKQMGYRHILVVDGYSTDRTTKVAKSNGCQVLYQHSQGKSGAIETAIEHVKTPYLLVMDGDCTYDPKDIESFLAHADKYDQIIGVRANGRKNIPRLNRFGNFLITKTFNLLMGTKLRDVCSGMYLVNTAAARQLELNANGFDVEVEIAAQTATKGRVTEVPIVYKKRVGQQKLKSWKHGFQIILSVFRLARTYNPALLFSGLVALAIVPASFILGWVALEVLLHGIWHSGYALTGLMLLVLASQGLTVATISLLLRRMERRIVRQTRRK